jgi:hypothetical protein
MTALATEIPLGGTLTAAQAREIFQQGEAAVVFALLELSQMLAKQKAAAAIVSSPATPSGMQPGYTKPNQESATPSKRRKKPGRKAGHPGNRRPIPVRIDERKDQRLETCLICHGELTRCVETRTRVIEDIPADLKPVVTEHTLHRDWCPRCQKKVEPKITEALPGATLGNRILVLSAWLHYGLGNTLSQIIEVFNFHLPLKLSPGGLIQMWYRLQEVLYPWYQQIQQEALQSAVLFADETSWRVKGATHWLWAFSTTDAVYYMIDRSRGSPALKKFFIEEFSGTLVSDFWGAYNAVACAQRQTCLPHLLRDLMHVEQYKSPSHEWPEFAKKLRRLLGDAIRLWKRERPKETVAGETYASRRARLDERLQELIDTPWEDKQARRLVKRLRRHQADLFTFLDQLDVPFDNNHAERIIRPAVIIRKNSYCNRSERGADAQAVLMSIYRTLKMRGHDPIATIVKALTDYLRTGILPPLPPKVTPIG